MISKYQSPLGMQIVENWQRCNETFKMFEYKGLAIDNKPLLHLGLGDRHSYISKKNAHLVKLISACMHFSSLSVFTGTNF